MARDWKLGVWGASCAYVGMAAAEGMWLIAGLLALASFGLRVWAGSPKPTP